MSDARFWIPERLRPTRWKVQKDDRSSLERLCDDMGLDHTKVHSISVSDDGRESKSYHTITVEIHNFNGTPWPFIAKEPA